MRIDDKYRFYLIKEDLSLAETSTNWVNIKDNVQKPEISLTPVFYSFDGVPNRKRLI
jgi:hypothetical protein